MNQLQLRQGDVYLTRLDAVPDGVPVSPEKGLFVLARGEATGHLHAVSASRARLLRDAIGLVLVVARAARLRHGDPERGWHGDHPDVRLPPGAYRVTIDREYRPSGWRQVAD